MPDSTPDSIELRLIAPAPSRAPQLHADILPLIREALEEENQLELLSRGEITVEQPANFLGLAVAESLVLLHFATQTARDVFTAIVLPRLKQRFGVSEKKKEPKPKKS